MILSLVVMDQSYAPPRRTLHLTPIAIYIDQSDLQPIISSLWIMQTCAIRPSHPVSLQRVSPRGEMWMWMAGAASPLLDIHDDRVFAMTYHARLRVLNFVLHEFSLPHYNHPDLRSPLD